MLHEVLIALTGNTGNIFVEKEYGSTSMSNVQNNNNNGDKAYGFKVAEFVDFIGPSEREELEDLVDVGFRYKRLSSLIDNQLNRPKSSYVRVMCTAMKKIADEYTMEIAKVEKQILSVSMKSHLTIAHLRHSFASYKTLFKYFFDILFECESLSLCGGELLNCLHEKCKVCEPALKPYLKFVLLSVERTFYRQLISWVSEGLINDRYNDFFILERDMEHMSISNKNNGNNNNKYNHNQYSQRAQRSQNQQQHISSSSLRQNKQYVDAFSAERAWNLQFILRLDRVPTSYVSYEIAEKVLFIGKVVKLLNEFRKIINRDRDSPSKQRLNKLLDGTEGPMRKIKDTVTKLLNPEIDFSMSILELEINIVHNAVSCQLYDLLIKDSLLNEHLQAVKDYFLLSKGEFFQCIIDECVDMFKKPPSAFATQDINSGPLRHAGSKLDLLSNLAYNNLSFRLYAPSFIITNFQPETNENIILNEYSTYDKSSGTIYLNCPSSLSSSSNTSGIPGVVGGFSRSSLSNDIIPSRSSRRIGENNNINDHYNVSSVGGGIVYREAKVVEFGYASTITGRIHTSNETTTFNNNSSGYASSKKKCGFCFVLHNAQLGALHSLPVDDIPNSISFQVTLVDNNRISVQIKSKRPTSALMSTYDITNEEQSSNILADTIIDIFDKDDDSKQNNVTMVDVTMRVVYKYDANPYDININDNNNNNNNNMKCLVYLAFAMSSKDEGDTSNKIPKLKIPFTVNPVITCNLDVSETLTLSNSSDGGQAWVGIGTISNRFNANNQVQISSWNFESILRKDSSFDAWTKLQLTYDIPWPLQLVISQTDFAKYNDMFRFLFTIKRVSASLQECWATLMYRAANIRGTGNLSVNKVYIRLSHLRSRMLFLVNALQYFLHVDVLEVQWHILQKQLSQVRDYDSLKKAHSRFVSSIRRQCFLDAKTIRRTLDSVFRLCVALCNLVEENEKDLTKVKQIDIAKIDSEYTRHSNYLFLVLSGISPSLKMRLDYNGTFTSGANDLGQA